MDPDPSFLIIGFSISLALSGFLSGVKHIVSFFLRYHDRLESESFIQTSQKAIQFGQKEGFSETILTWFVLLDGTSVILGSLCFYRMIPQFFSISNQMVLSILSCAISILSILIAHQVAPVFCQMKLNRCAAIQIWSFSIFWFLLGWLGKSFSLFKKWLLKKSGFYRHYQIIDRSDLNKLKSDETILSDTGLKKDKAEMVQNIFNIGSTQVKEIFTPRIDTIALSVNASYPEVLALIREKRYSRIPVYKESIDTIAGILHVKDLFGIPESARGESFQLEHIVRPAMFIPRSKKIDDLMAEFKLKHSHIAIVVDEYGGTAGIITLEDILEEIVGEIQDEDDSELPLVSKVDEKSFIIDPIITLDDLNHDLSLFLKPADDVEIDTLGGYIQYLKGSIPIEGDIISNNGYTFEILNMDGQSIEKVRLTISD